MYDDYSSIFTGFLLALVIIPLVASGTRNSLKATAVKTAVVHGLVVAGLLVQYVHLVYVATFAPHHSTWSGDNNYVRYDCFRSEKGGKLADDFRDCLMGQGDACTEAEPCTPCPAGGNASSASTDFHRYITNYTQFLCRNCTEPYRSLLDCQFAPQHGPFCLVDDNADAAAVAAAANSRRQCPSAEVTELLPRDDVPQLPFFMLQELGYVDEDGNVHAEGGNTSSDAQSAWEYSYHFPTPSGGRACERCCTRQWDEDDWIPADPEVDPPGGGFTRFVSVELAPGAGGRGQPAGVYYTLDGADPDPCVSNGAWFVDPIELEDIGTTVLRAVSTFRGLRSRNVVEAVFEIVECSDEWFLEMSSQYPSGGLANDKAALVDAFPQDTGAGTGDKYTNKEGANWIAMRFSAIVFLDQLTLSVYSRDRWNREELVGARLEYFNTTLSDLDDTPFDTAMNDPAYAGDWFFLAELNESAVPDAGSFAVPLPADVGIKYLRLRSDSWLAVGTLRPNVTGCYNSTSARNDTDTTGSRR